MHGAMLEDLAELEAELLGEGGDFEDWEDEELEFEDLFGEFEGDEEFEGFGEHEMEFEDSEGYGGVGTFEDFEDFEDLEDWELEGGWGEGESWESEAEMEFEDAFALDMESDPEASDAYALMETYALRASRADTEAEADRLLGAIAGLVPTLVRAAPRIISAGKRVLKSAVPVVARGAKRLLAGARGLAGRARRFAQLVRQAVSRLKTVLRSRGPRVVKRFLRLVPQIIRRALARLVPRGASALNIRTVMNVVQRITFNLLNIRVGNVTVNVGGGGRRPTPPARRGGGRSVGRPRRSRRVIRPRYCVL